MICDFAETYHLYDWRAVPIETAAALAVGLRADSRVKMKLSGLPEMYTLENIMLARASDALEWLVWSKTKAAQENMNRPKSLLETMLKEDVKPDTVSFNTPEEFERERARIIGRSRG